MSATIKRDSGHGLCKRVHPHAPKPPQVTADQSLWYQTGACLDQSFIPFVIICNLLCVVRSNHDDRVYIVETIYRWLLALNCHKSLDNISHVQAFRATLCIANCFFSCLLPVMFARSLCSPGAGFRQKWTKKGRDFPPSSSWTYPSCQEVLYLPNYQDCLGLVQEFDWPTPKRHYMFEARPQWALACRVW